MKETKSKNPAAVAMGRKGGQVKHPGKGMGGATPQARAEWAAKMAEARRVKREREREQGGEGKGDNAK